MKKYRLTILFAVTAVAVIAVAAVVVNIVIGNLTEDNLIRIAEENTARDGEHIQSMMRMMGPTSSMGGMASDEATRMTQDSGSSMGDNDMRGWTGLWR